MAPAEQIVREAIEAHGGATRWRGLAALEAEISAWGLLFTLKRQPVLDHVRVRASTREPRFAFLNVPPGRSSELLGEEEVRIVEADGSVSARRAQPRAAFRGLRRQLYWDRLDFTYFGGYATWNYLTTPFLFLRPGFAFETLQPLPGTPAGWARLRVAFPPDVPTHSRIQEFTFDEQRLLRRLDYVAEVVGGWARAAHLCGAYRNFGGLRAPTRRRVRPLPFGSKPLPGPTLVAIEIHDILLVPGE